MIPGRDPAPTARQTFIEDYDIDLGEWIGSDVGTALREGPTAAAYDISRLTIAEAPEVDTGGRPIMPGYGGVGSSAVGAARALGIGWDDAPRLTPEQANAEFGVYGLKFAKPVRRQVAQMLADQKQRQAERDSINERWRHGGGRDGAGFFRGVGSVAATLAGSMLDPLNVLSAFVPVVGEARFASMAGSIGKGAALGVKGGVEGVAGAAMLEPLTYAGAQARGQEYGLGDSFQNIAIGGLLGGTLNLAGHVAGRGVEAAGAAIDARRMERFRGRAAKLLDELAPEATPDQRETLMAMSIAQMQNGHPVDVAGYAEAEGLLIRKADRDAVAEFDALFSQAMEDAGRPDPVDGRLTLAEAPSSRWRAGEAGEDGRFSRYDPLRPADARWLKGEVYALENAAGGSRLFREVDGQGSTPDVIGQKSESPDWFQKTNAEAKRNASFRRRKGEAAAEGLRTRGITKAEVRKVADKLLSREPLTRGEAETAELLMDVVRGKRAEDAGQRVADRARRREAFDRYLDDFARREAGEDGPSLSAIQALSEPAKTARGPMAEPEWGEFGPIFRERDLKSAVARLMREQDGEVPGALHHPETGPIDLFWGKEGSGNSNGYGLSKIVKFHPEVLNDLQGPLNDMVVVSRTPNRVRLESATHEAAVSLEFKGKAKIWLLTEYEKKPAGGDRTMNGAPDGEADGSPLPGREDNLPLIREPRNRPPPPGPAAQEAMAALADAQARVAPFLDALEPDERAGIDAADAMARAADAEGMAADSAAVCILRGLS